MSFAATKIDDPLVPTSPDTVTETQYGEIDEFEDEPVAESGITLAEFEEETIPEGGELPQTGGIPAEAFYVIGGIFIISAVILLTRKSKPSAK